MREVLLLIVYRERKMADKIQEQTIIFQGWKKETAVQVPTPHMSGTSMRGLNSITLSATNRTLVSLDREISVPDEQTILHGGSAPPISAHLNY